MDKALQVINALAGEFGWWVYLVVAVIVAYVLMKIYIWVDKSSQAILHMKRSPEERDSVRVYTRQEKNEALTRCRRRCEGTGIFFRCRTRDGDKGKGLQGDHWFPHARGGATTEKNLVMLCPKCNGKKSDKIPLRIQTYALNRRRRKGKGYAREYPYGVGEWRERGYRNDNPRLTSRQRRLRELKRPPTV